ncbi:hypothetical protein ACISKN_06930, partial [Campylobacter coli]
MENFKAFKLISKRIIKTLLNDFPNQSILFSDDFNKDCKPFSYPHLTLPTMRKVYTSGVADSQIIKRLSDVNVIL